ncbi:MAG: glycosyltransferase [Planctomycetota bacterium]
MSLDSLGIVAIGRNEGSRLRLCLESLRNFELPTIYVDSNSSDDSVEIATEQGTSVLQLDPNKPMSAARARREGFRKLLGEHQSLEFVFFVDGDCQVDADWPEAAVDFLRGHDRVGAVCGRRREQHPDLAVYNRLCDHEWDTPIGEALSVGGDAVYRVSAYREAGEFDPTVPAGEEPELCKRMRDCGWTIQRMAADMTRHDAAMTSFGQWWQRQIRTGYAGYDVERRFRLGIFDRILRSAFAWTAIPIVVAIFAAVVLRILQFQLWPIAALLIAAAVVSLQTLRIAKRAKSSATDWKHALQFGFFTMTSKLPIALGAIRQIIATALGRQARIVEYKSAETLRHQS